jgi:deoxycytidine triphosphate deaminase
MFAHAPAGVLFLPERKPRGARPRRGPAPERRMTVKSDRWIRRMAAEQRMIEPYEPGQVREIDGRRIVSYGTSSYGYDIRCSSEFKIFTNINSTIVDPKRFDAGSFVDFSGDVCIIPPNSFALARTVEYFRIPRNVLVVCLGKCVTGDTRVVDADTGAWRPIAELAGLRRTVALDGWRTVEAPVSHFLPQGRKPVFELRTRAGLRIRATANHPFRQLHGWTPLSSLRPGDRIAAAREVSVFGRTPLPDWEASLLGLMISEGQCSTPGHSPTFTSEDPVLVALLERAVAAGGLGVVTARPHHGYRLVNHAGRGGIPERNRATSWLESHGLAVGAEGKFVPQAVFTAPQAAVRLFLQALFSGDGGVYGRDDAFYVEYYSKSRRLVEDVRHLLLRFGVFSLMREKVTAIGTPAFKVQITDREQIRRFEERVGFCPGSIKDVRLRESVLPGIAALATPAKSNFDTLPREAWPMLVASAAQGDTSLNRLGIGTNPSQSVGRALFARAAQALQRQELSALLDGPVWDTVTSIEPAGEEDVFDISVPGVHNFLANDLVVHNSTYARCGIIVNVTPLEPEWEGHVTLEFSNTTPLPAKIYANEGVAQVIFFESDEVCETSYKDRGGKYQGQQGVTLPRI